jgi:putative tricarboxylic transport membrane protein
MGFLENLTVGFGNALALEMLFYAFLGVLLGQIVGVLPGIGPPSGMAVLLPLTFVLPPAGAIIMLAGIHYGASYGGTITSVLIGVPGESSNIMTAIDGYAMGKRGAAGKALSIAAVGSFVAGTLGTVVLMMLAPQIARLGLMFGAPEMALLVAIGLATVASFGQSQLRALLMVLFGIWLASVGTDPVFGDNRFTLGSRRMLDGFHFVPVTIGLFGIAEIIANLEADERAKPIKMKLRNMWPTKAEWRRCLGPFGRASSLGFMIGVIPGPGVTVASFMAYEVERQRSKTPEEFGSDYGSIEGVAAVDAANNAGNAGQLAPLLALGLPGSPATAILLSAFIIHGIRPGPLLMEQQSELVWTLIASLYIGNVLLLIMNLPLAPLWAYVLRIPFTYLAPGILFICLLGSYSVSNRMFDVWIAVAFGVIGYMMRKVNLPAAPLILGLVLGPLLETSVRQALTLSLGDPMVFVRRPLTQALFILLVVSLVWPQVQAFRRRKGTAREDSALERAKKED